MQDTMYNMGYAVFWGVIIMVALFCINKIRKNRAEIKRLEAELEKENKEKQAAGGGYRLFCFSGELFGSVLF